MVSHWSLSDSKSPGLFSVFCSLDGLQSSSYFNVLQSLYQSFGDSTKSTNYNWYHRHFHIPQFFPCNYLSFRVLSILHNGQTEQKSPQFDKFSFFCWILFSPVVWPTVYTSHFPGRILDCAYTICSYGQFQFLAQFPVDHFAHPVVSSLILFLC